ncbi:MAG: hypothetical protein Q7J05_02545 [Paludibacter sp.]|nr:hypothetical protein [Paludibacter sp.]
MKTLKILIFIIVCLVARNIILAQNTGSIAKYKVTTIWKANSGEFELIESYNAELETTAQLRSDYNIIPDVGECWMIKNQQEYSLICRNPRFNSAVFNEYNFFIASGMSSGCNTPMAKADLYLNGKENKNTLYIFVTPQSLCKNGLFVTFTFLVPKKYCNNISNITWINKINYELIKKVQDSTQYDQ